MPRVALIGFVSSPVMTIHTLTFRANEKVLMKIAPVSADGLPAQLDAAPVITSSDPSVVTIVPYFSDNYLVSVAPGSASVTVQATSFGNDVSEQIDVTITDATAVSLGITFAAPVKK